MSRGELSEQIHEIVWRYYLHVVEKIWVHSLKIDKLEVMRAFLVNKPITFGKLTCFLLVGVMFWKDMGGGITFSCDDSIS